MTEPITFTEALDACIENFGPAPRRFSFMDRMNYLRVPKPMWLRLRPTDELNLLFKNLRVLLEEGIVVWGHIVQANSLLFEKGEDDCPGVVVYSLEDREKVEPRYLANLAESLFEIKGVKLNRPDLAAIADFLEDEHTAVFGLPVPQVMSKNVRCRISVTFFARKHLPRKRICTPLMPIIVNPNKPHVALPLPERFWPDELVEWWRE